MVGLDEKVDFVALSFVRGPEDLRNVREIISGATHHPMLIAKIEKPQAVENFEQILAAVDAVMVARGDLGVEMPLEEVPMIQKRIIQTNQAGGKTGHHRNPDAQLDAGKPQAHTGRGDRCGKRRPGWNRRPDALG